jgi:hypothetical protein
MINRDEVRENVTNLAVFRLHAGKDETVDQYRKTLSASHSPHNIGSLPRLGKHLRGLRMAGAVDVPHIVRPSG